MNCPRFLLSCCVGMLLSVAGLKAQTTFTWTGTQGSDFANNNNWVGEVAPPNDGSATLVFGDIPNTFVNYDEILSIAGLQFLANSRPYFLYIPELELGSQGIIYSPLFQQTPYPTPSQIYGYDLYLNASQTWSINDGVFAVWANLATPAESDPITLTKLGAGTLDLRGDGYDSSPWNGNLVIRDGSVIVHPVADFFGEGSAPITSLGTGTVTIDDSQGGMPGIIASDYTTSSEGGYYDDLEVIIPNDFSLNGRISVQAETDLFILGDITLAGDTTLAPSGAATFLHGLISESGESRKLTIDGTSLVVLDPQLDRLLQGGNEGSLNSYTGGTHVQSGGLIFATAESLPDQGQLTMSPNGYIGYGDTLGVGVFLGKFDAANAAGTIGFDTDPESVSPNYFENNIDLTGFNTGVKLGSVTSAILGGTITPAGTNYQFGGGGGLLIVDTPLTDNGETPRAVVLSSDPSLPLAVWVTSTGNTFTGGVQATNGAVILGGDWPTTGNFALGPGGYIGTGPVSPLATDQDYAAHIARYTGNQGVIGFDNSLDAESTRVLANNLHLPNGYAFGTASRAIQIESLTLPGVRLTGQITGAVVDNVQNLRFAGYRGGALEVASALTNVDEDTFTRVYIGDPFSTGTFGSPNDEEYSVVALTGDNSYSGTTTLYTGHLIIGQSNGVVGSDATTALGTGALIVQPHNITLPGEDQDELYPHVSVMYHNTIIDNDITLNSNLSIGGDNNLRLTGNLSGSGNLIIGEESDYGIGVQIEGANGGFSGDIYIDGDSSVTFAGDTSAGTGLLGFGRSPIGSVYFTSLNPVIGGLESDQGGYVNLATGSVLTINQTEHTTFRGEIYGGGVPTIVSGGGFAPPEFTTVDFTGPGSLRFTNDQYVDEFHVSGGTVVVGNDGEGSGIELGDIVRLQGGAIVLQNSTLYATDLVLQSGTLAGSGRISLYGETTPSVGAGVVLSPGTPGDGGLGTLRFDDLILASGGTYVWSLRDSGSGDAQYALHDFIEVGSFDTLTITATSEDPFIITPVTLTSSGVNGILGGLNEWQTYSWTLMSYLSVAGITQQFNPDNVQLDLGSLFQTTLPGTATLEFTNLDGAGYVMLHFTAVPEPSTYALLALGLGFVGFTVWRRRRAA